MQQIIVMELFAPTIILLTITVTLFRVYRIQNGHSYHDEQADACDDECECGDCTDKPKR